MPSPLAYDVEFICISRFKTDMKILDNISDLLGDDLGSVLIGHSQKMTVAASATAEKKTVGQRS